MAWQHLTRRGSAIVSDSLQTIPANDDYPVGVRGMLCDLAAAFILLTRIPIPWARLNPTNPELKPNINRSLWAFPLVGFCVSVIGAMVFTFSLALHLPSLLAAALAILAMIFTTGGYHEDGLADVADGFGGGREKDRKLEIMRDSWVGTYGIIALVMSLVLRVITLGYMSLSLAIAALLVTGALSRFWMLCTLKAMAPARKAGSSAAAGIPQNHHILIAAAFSLGVCFLLLPVTYVFPVIAVAFVAFLVVSLISHQQIGGHTGDVLGTVQQVTEIAILICVLSLWRNIS